MGEKENAIGFLVAVSFCTERWHQRSRLGPTDGADRKKKKRAFRSLTASSLEQPGVFKPVADNRSQMSVSSVTVDSPYLYC